MRLHGGILKKGEKGRQRKGDGEEKRAGQIDRQTNIERCVCVCLQCTCVCVWEGCVCVCVCVLAR